MPRYAFFDFDGTLISKDSFLILLKTSFRRQPWRLVFIIFFLPILAATAVFKWDKTLAKSLLLWSATVLRGKKGALQFFEGTMREICDKVWFQEALDQFAELERADVGVVIVSASGTAWIRALLRCKYQKSRLIIGSRLGFFMGGIVLTAKNCYGEEKIRRIQEVLGKEFVWHSAWSDHVADLPMLRKAELRYVICPKAKHVAIFERELNKNYKLLNWMV